MSLFGVFGERIQAVLPSRVLELTGILLHSLAAVMAVAASAALGSARRDSSAA